MMHKAVIFDLDGTLVDSQPLWFEATRKLFSLYGKEYGIVEHKMIMDRPADVCVKMLQEYFGMTDASTVDLVEQRMKNFESEIREQGMKMKPGARELVTALFARGIGLGIASNADGNGIKNILRLVNLEQQFVNPVGREDVENGKPAPDVYLAAATRLGVDPAKCLAVEDSPVGTQAAHAAGMTILGILDPRFVDELPLAKKVVESFSTMTAEEMLSI